MLTPLDEPESLADARRFDREKTRALAQGMCEPCAVQTAYGMIHGLYTISRLGLCRACERKLNPEPVFDRTRNKWVTRKPSRRDNATCAVCGNGFTTRRSTARYCSGRCRQRAHRVKSGASA